MERLRTDSTVSRQIVAAFIDFLNSVEPAPGVDIEAIEVAKECLLDVFKPDLGPGSGLVQPNMLVDIFNLARANLPRVQNPVVPSKSASHQTEYCYTVSTNEGSSQCHGKAQDALQSNAAQLQSRSQEDGTSSLDLLFMQFLEGLENAGFLAHRAVGSPEYMEDVRKARDVLKDTLDKMKKDATDSELDSKVLAEAFKVQGNMAMASKDYQQAVELYTLAISLFADSAVYYCNRAAAHTQVCNYKEAMEDCKRSIEIDPNYSKAYSRLGLIYYAQGNYQDAIQMGFLKALKLDPCNTSIKENIKMATEKLEELQRQRHGESSRPEGQTTTSDDHCSDSGTNHKRSKMSGSGFSSTSADRPFGSEFANVLPDFVNTAMNFSEAGTEFDPATTAQNPNMQFSIDGEELPQNLTGFMQSMLQMFSGHGSQQRDAGGGVQ